MNAEKPVAWMMTQDGEFLDAIDPIEHAREEGTYTIPLYTHTNEQAVIDAFERGRAFGYAEGLKKVKTK